MTKLQKIVEGTQTDDEKVESLIELLQDELSIHNANE